MLTFHARSHEAAYSVLELFLQARDILQFSFQACAAVQTAIVRLKFRCISCRSFFHEDGWLYLAKRQIEGMQRLGMPQYQKSTRLESLNQLLHYFKLRATVKVDEHVPAEDHILHFNGPMVIH